jgi:hypothetical protein
MRHLRREERMTRRFNELLLGFDAREMWRKFSEDWSEERQRRFLLRRDIIKPLSTWTGVWQPVFEAQTSEQPPEWSHAIMGLWDNLVTLQEYLDTVWSARTYPYWLIAVTLHREERQPESLVERYAQSEEIIPALRDPAWGLLGYDVCDEWLLSGLTDLAWGDGSPDEVQAISQKYLPSLNEYHLFTSVDSAAEFIPLAEEGAPSHAPFFVFGLWLIKKIEDARC